MHIQRILVPLVGSDNNRSGLELGLILARDLDAHVDAMFVRPDPEDAVPYLGMDDGSLRDIRESFRQRAEIAGKKAAAKLRRQYFAACRKRGIDKAKRANETNGASAYWIDAVGQAIYEVPIVAKFCDLTIFGGPSEHYRGLSPNVLESTFLESGRPFLFAPDGLKEYPPDRVVIAWDASMPAVHAMAAAWAFIRQARYVRVVSIEERYGDRPDPQKLVDYLAWHGLDAEPSAVPGNDEPVGALLLSEAEKVEASLLVMGGYAHRRMREMVFGGATFHVIGHAQIPIFMMH